MASTDQMLKEFALQHIGSGKDIDDVLDEQRYGHITGLNQRHKWGLDPGVGTPLQLCASGGGVEACALLIEAKANVNFEMPNHGVYGAPPLHLAIKNGSLELVKNLLEQGADVALQADMLGSGALDATQFARALAVQDPSPARQALSHLVAFFNMPNGPIAKTELTSKSAPIPAENPVNFVKELIGTGRDLNEIRGGLKWAQVPDCTPLAAVTEAGDTEAVRMLLAAGADVNRLNGMFGGPLHFAIKNNRIDLVKILLDAGADKHAKVKDPQAMSALEYARWRGTQQPENETVCHLVEYHNHVWPTPNRPGM